MRYTSVVALCITISCGLLLFLGEVRYEFSGTEENRQLAKFWEGQYRQEQIKRQLLSDRAEDFKQNVAKLLPDSIEEAKDDEVQKYQLRNLASVVTHESEEDNAYRWSSDRLIKEGRALFLEKKYNYAVKMFARIIEKFPDSMHTIEAYYLTAEAKFHKRELKESIDWIEKMVHLFPDNRLTGYSLFRLGQIFELQSRYQDALEIYKTVVASYEDEKLIQNAQKAIEEIEL